LKNKHEIRGKELNEKNIKIELLKIELEKKH
jgi:hypothetical protein